MRKGWIAFAAAALVLCAVRAAFAEEALAVRDSVVAVVNRDVITRKDVLDRAAPALDAVDKSLSPADQDKLRTDLIGAALWAIIEERLLTAEAMRLVNANEAFRRRVEERVNIRLEEERRQAGGELPFREAIGKKGLSYSEYVEETRKRMLRDVVVYQFVLRDLSAGPAEVLSHYRGNPAEFQEPAQVKYRQIFIRAESYESRAKARETADYIVGLLKKQYDFAPLAEKYSDDPRAKEGGLWDFQRKGARPQPIDDLLFSLPIGEVGGPVETDLGFTILRVEERKEGRLKPFEEVQPGIEAMLIRRKRMDRYSALIQRLQKENYLEILR